MNRIRQALFFLVLVALAAPAAEADWTYEYADDFSTDDVQYECYLSSTFWTNDVNPLFRPYLYCLGTGTGRGLVFVDYRGEPARLEYRFPPDSSQADKLVRGTLRFDVSFPCNADISQFPPGQLSCSVSPNGLTWSTAQSLQAGHYEIPISSPEGACYVLFTGTRALLDNLRVSLAAPAATLRVPQNYPTIQQAIDAAGNGSIIEVGNGTYTGTGNTDIDFRGKRITVRSTNGPSVTIIDCGKPTSGRRRGFYFHQAETADSVLSGFTIQGGRVFGTTIPSDASHWTSNASNPIGGGIYCEFSSPTITNCIISDCGAELGAGIGCVGGEPTILGCTIEECFAGGLGSSLTGGRGGGIALTGRCNAKIADCTIEDNSCFSNTQGGGLYCYQSVATLAGCTIAGNFAAGGNLRGGGVYCGGDGTDVTLQNCVISQNTADAGSGVSVQRLVTAVPSVTTAGARCRVSIINCTIAQNWVVYPYAYPAQVGGVESAGADITIRNSIVWFNGGTPLAITNAAVTTPVTYSNIQQACSGEGNLSADPRFASTSSLPDYHLQSTVGRYDPQYSRWVTDSVQSPCIDAGDPKASAAEEPAPNGDRINLGAYGGTRQASKGATHYLLYVDQQTGHDWNNGRSHATAFATLKRAIDTAQNGDTVLVWPGTYEEEITFDHKAITVQSAADPAVLTAPDGYACSFFGAENSKSILANFVITGCSVGGVFCDGASPTLRNLTVVENQFGIVGYGGADPNIINCIIWENANGPLFQCKARYSCIDQTNPDKKVGNINANPLFADSQNGDYHLRSRWGRYAPLTGTWTLDSTTSPCIDAGDPADSPRDERMPNGSRVNMGSDGGTAFASLSSGPVCR
jgi:hypothetical protein